VTDPSLNNPLILPSTALELTAKEFDPPYWYVELWLVGFPKATFLQTRRDGAFDWRTEGSSDGKILGSGNIVGEVLGCKE